MGPWRRKINLFGGGHGQIGVIHRQTGAGVALIGGQKNGHDPFMIRQAAHTFASVARLYTLQLGQRQIADERAIDIEVHIGLLLRGAGAGFIVVFAAIQRLP